MSLFTKLRWSLVGIFGRKILWLWTKSTQLTVLGTEGYQKIRDQNKPVVFIVWHGRIFIVPYFFRKRDIMPLISPSKDGEIAAKIMSRWGYKILRGSGSHVVVKAWNEMKDELKGGGELIIVSDGPKGPNRKMKPGGIKLASETGAYLVPFSFSTSKKKFLNSWDKFLMFKPFSKVVAVYGEPISIKQDLSGDEIDLECKRVESILIQLDKWADQYFDS
jgi:lysophospholipid acyltransferase (LPLAT)-like uncharacterized protein